MTRILGALVLFALMLPAQALDWAGLWRNPDQQGEALLQRGDAAAAAKVYTDRRRKAYAELKAGDYRAAAHDLAGFDDSDAEYNRGNALAHAGDLQGAIGAYDAALKRDPDNRDAAHNRELVQNALKQQPPQQQNSGQSKQDKQDQDKAGGQNSNSDGSDKSAQGQGKQQGGQQGDNRGASAQDQPGQQRASGSQSGGSQSGQQGGKPGSQPGQDANGRQQSAADRQAQSGQADDSSAQPGERQQGAATAGQQAGQAAQGRDDAEQARRDAAAGLGQTGDQNGSADQSGRAGEQRPPQTEQQLAQDQWLHSIPDDPGGLLRRKFMIEHMLRQQKATP
jgi:Ca-activated chloride channel family protein